MRRESADIEPQKDLDTKSALHRLESLLSDTQQGGTLPFVAEEACRTISKMFGVREHEVALLKKEERFLKFVFPRDLTRVGTIPLSSSAIAARTAIARKAERFNSFPKVKHLWLFESARGARENESGCQPEVRVIQKLMSAPVLAENGEVLAVVQVSRKGLDTSKAGPDFTQEDLQKLECAAVIMGKMMLAAEVANGRKLRT